MRLIEPDRHEGLSAQRWDERAARRAIEAIARDCEERFSPDGLWPPHPLDTEGKREAPFTMLYMGAAGVIWALDDLARRGMALSTAYFAPMLGALAERNIKQIEPWNQGVESYLMGRSGVLLTHYRVRPSREVADRLAESIAANTRHPSRELLLGAPGTMHAALAMHEWTGEERWAELFRSGAKALEATLIDGPERCQLWDQDLYGSRSTYLGAAHGFAGNAGVLIRGLALLPQRERDEWTERIVAATLATVIREGALANWPPAWASAGARERSCLVQWCHGAPGFVTNLADLADSRLDDVLTAAGELIWTAGPLTKGGGLCHGTAGNGYAFLKLFRRTGDERWLERARAFAMHAVAQGERHAATYMRRYSLYTGDPGVAIYLTQCIDGTAVWPGLDAEARLPTARAGL
ncbi:MAG: LanC-like protein [Pseudomonadota bacterium]|nr:LanC-like protein [Pseudomonadota bacterium]